MKPETIEAESFGIIQETLERMGQGKRLEGIKGAVLTRVIHATADFSFADTLTLSDSAVKKGIQALTKGQALVTDVEMVRAGVNKKGLEALGGAVHCFMADEDVAKEAKSLGITRASVAMQKAARLFPKAIYAIGNAPTALLELIRLTLEGKMKPELVIGVPVGFVMAAESKEKALDLEQSGVPVIVARGPKGGSSVAASVVNALIRLALEGSHGIASQ